MARLHHTGFEIDPTRNVLTAAVNPPDLQWDGTLGAHLRNTVEHRSGATCVTLGAFSTNTSFMVAVALDVASRSNFFRVYMKFAQLPSNTIRIMQTRIAKVSVRLTPAGKLQLWNDVAATQIGSDSSATVVVGTYFRLELMYSLNASSQLSDTAARLDGVEIASTSGLALAVGTGGLYMGIINVPGVDVACYLDDFAMNDSTSVANNSWPGPGRVVLMRPLADLQRGSWTGGVGGITNLFQAVRNTPPIGTATETNTSQIESADSSGDNATDEYRADCGSYTFAGVGASDTIDAIQVWDSNGEDVSTGTKTVSSGCQANPANAYGASTAGENQGALGTWPTAWAFGNGQVLNLPTVTKGSSLVLACRKTDTGTRVASISFLGAYVSYIESVGGGSTYTKSGFGREDG